MARPREFDENEVLNTVLGVFWSRGYEGASIQDLVDATGLGRASLYGAFGGKKELFQKALARYRERMGGVVQAVAAEPSARRALRTLFAAWVTSTCPQSGPRGCFMLLSGTTGNLQDAWVRDLMIESQLQSEAVIERLIRLGQDQGEITKSRDVASLVAFLAVTLQGLSSAARAGWSLERLQVAVGEALAHLDAEPDT